MHRAISIILFLLLGLPAYGSNLHVACAANFRATLEQISQQFTASSGHHIVISSASSGTLYQQILYGAPFDILLAADNLIPERLAEQGLAQADSLFTYAEGRLVLAYRPQLSAQAAAGPAVLLGEPKLNLVIANPEHAPYGRAAQQVLRLHPQGQDSLLLRGANVGQAFQIWHSGGADLALVAASYRPAHFLDIPAHWYEPLRQQAVILSASQQSALAQAFMRFLASAATRRLIESQGYRLPAPEQRPGQSHG